MSVTRRWRGLVGISALLGVLGLSAAHAGLAQDSLGALKLARFAPGTDAPAFTLKSLDGQVVASRALSGKVVLLNFWATWCVPCREEMPALERLRKSVDPNEFALIAITADIRPKEIRAFFKELGLGFPTLLDEDQDVSMAYRVRGLPMTFLIGKDGKLVAWAAGPRNWDSPEMAALIRTLTAQGE